MNTTRRQFLKAAVAVPIAIAAGVSVRDSTCSNIVTLGSVSDHTEITIIQRGKIIENFSLKGTESLVQPGLRYI